MVTILLAGHGIDTPSIKEMNSYCTSRQTDNKGLIEVRRFPNLSEIQRQALHDAYTTLLGRNLYSQELRMFCYEPYDGIYYSDCSSSICLTADKIGIHGYADLDTAGMHYHLEKANEVMIENGMILNPEVLQVGDCLMFKGSDSSRPLQIGHTEMVYEIN